MTSDSTKSGSVIQENHPTTPSTGQAPGGKSDQKSSIWFRIHLIYYLLTLALFGFVLLMAWIAWTSDWIPSRGIGR